MANPIGALFNRLNIGQRLTYGFGILVLFTFIVGVVALISDNIKEQALADLDEANEKAILAERIKAELLQARLLEKDFLLLWSTEEFSTAVENYVTVNQERTQNIRDLVGEFREFGSEETDDEVFGLMDEIEQQSLTYDIGFGRVVNRMGTRGANEEDGVFGQVAQNLAQIETLLSGKDLPDLERKASQNTQEALFYLADSEQKHADAFLVGTDEFKELVEQETELSTGEKEDLLAAIDDAENGFAGLLVLDSALFLDIDVFRTAAERIEPASDKLVKLSSADEIVAQDNFDSISQLARLLEIIFLILTVLLGIVLAIVIHRSIVQPLDELVEVTQGVGTGDYALRAQVTNDEIGELAYAFNEMADAIQTREKSLHEARQEAELANQVKSQFLATVSHELRTPLNSIINYTKFVIRGLMGPITEKQQEMLTKVVGSGEHLLNLINDVLDISKIESGSLELFIEDDINLEQEISPAISVAESLLAEKPAVVLQVEIDDNLPCIKGDRQRILQIMFNLISNACKFTDEGSIVISGHVQNGEIILAVKDTGPGIAPDDYETVFETFKQTEAGLQKSGGTGLGLPISRRLAEAHGGRLWLESVVGEGSTFYVALPNNAGEQPLSSSKI